MHPRTDSDPIRLGATRGTAMILLPVPGEQTRLAWVGSEDAAGASSAVSAEDVARAIGVGPVELSNSASTGRAIPLVPEVASGWPGRPGLSGYRLGATNPGRDWSTAFATTAIESTGTAVAVDASDPLSGLDLRTEFEVVAGGALRGRHRITNRGVDPYVVAGLDVAIPLPDRVSEILDLTGRWGRERQPQCHRITDGVWLRESRGGRPGHEAVTELIAGTDGFGFRSGEVWAGHVAWSGNTHHFLQRQPSGLVTLGGGELLLPGEIILATDESYTTPWVFFVAGPGLDAIASQLHDYARSLPAHPRAPRPVVGNVWEAVLFDHDLERLTELADLAATVGIERFVLDDGWFGDRRDDHAGLGDWTVSADVWPSGLGPLIEQVDARGMQFGLWFEPEMVNADSNLFRAHPEWVLAVDGRPARESRNQLVLDLGQAAVRDYLFGQIDAVLSEYPIAYVKWDHNRDLLEAAARDRDGAPGAHAQTVGYYDLLDRLRAAHPDVEWESCASGGGRVDLGVLERTERVWTSDVTDALSRQSIQRWTAQLVPPEYIGAHVSSTVNHQTGRVLSLDFRAATALFGDFGVEWDMRAAGPDERARLAEWIATYKQYRGLLHSGRVVRVDSPDEAYWMYGVVAADGSAAVMAYVQLDDTVRDPLPFIVPALDPTRSYQARAIGPEPEPIDSPEKRYTDPWRGEGLVLTGATLQAIDYPRRTDVRSRHSSSLSPPSDPEIGPRGDLPKRAPGGQADKRSRQFRRGKPSDRGVARWQYR